MAFELRQELKLTQQLVMTPQLQQAIKLLQLSRLELLDTVQQEMNENPCLEEAGEEGEGAGEGPGEEAGESGESVSSDNETAEEFDWQSYIDGTASESYAPYREKEEQETFETAVTTKTSLADHLVWQLHLSSLSDEEIRIGSVLIGNIDHDGYLKIPLGDVAQQLCGDGWVAGGETAAARTLNWVFFLSCLQKVEHVLKRIQEFDPLGVGARDLQECLLVQARHLEGDHSVTEQILERHLHNLERKKYATIARDLQVSQERVVESARIIAQLEPKPGRGYGEEETQYITPDIYVYKVDDEYVVALNEDGLPKLRISSFYRGALLKSSSEGQSTREYVQEKLKSAMWLIKSIYHRQRTIRNVMKSIIDFQRDFFDHGAGRLKPLVLRDVAESVGMHESTISRVTTNKYVHTPHGIFELKYFFNSRIQAVDGESIGSESVRTKIKEILGRENSRHPYSDQQIVAMLKAENIKIARRTVAKYREAMGVLSSSKRKKY
jgi:RNA polymerase sigma-54 factor